MNVAPVPVGSRIFDSLPFSIGGTVEEACLIRSQGYDGFVGYLGAIHADLTNAMFTAGMGVMAVTFGSAYDGPAAVKQLKTAGLPPGVTVFFDCEGKQAYNTPPAQLAAAINDGAKCLQDAGYLAGLYLGSPQPLTSEELTDLAVTRYWHGQGRCVDRFGKLAEPLSGWCMWQMWPSVTVSGVLVDANIVGQDYRQRVPSWAVA